MHFITWTKRPLQWDKTKRCTSPPSCSWCWNPNWNSLSDMCIHPKTQASTIIRPELALQTYMNTVPCSSGLSQWQSIRHKDQHLTKSASFCLNPFSPMVNCMYVAFSRARRFTDIIIKTDLTSQSKCYNKYSVSRGILELSCILHVSCYPGIRMITNLSLIHTWDLLSMKGPVPHGIITVIPPSQIN